MLDFIRALDEDEGIRLEGNLNDRESGGFIFVGTYRGSYCVNVCDRTWSSRLREYLAGGNDRWLYFETTEETFDFVKKSAKRPLKAWLY